MIDLNTTSAHTKEQWAAALAEANDPTTAPDRLERLFRWADEWKSEPFAPAITQALVANPNVSPEWLVAQCSRYPEQVLANPAWRLLLVEAPALVLKFLTGEGLSRLAETGSEGLECALTLVPLLHFQTLHNALISAREPHLMAALVMHTRGSDYQILFDTTLLLNPSSPGWLLRWLARNSQVEYWHFLQNRRCPGSLVLDLIAKRDHDRYTFRTVLAALKVAHCRFDRHRLVPRGRVARRLRRVHPFRFASPSGVESGTRG